MTSSTMDCSSLRRYRTNELQINSLKRLEMTGSMQGTSPMGRARVSESIGLLSPLTPTSGFADLPSAPLHSRLL